MQTLRFNPFNQIHKGLRALLYDTALLIQHADFTRADDKRKVSDRIELVGQLFDSHAHVEDSLVFPMIAGFAPDVVDDFESQHRTDHELTVALHECLGQFSDSNSPEQDRWAGNELLQAFNSFLAFNVEHMKKEETTINGVLWQHYSDAQLMQKMQQIAASMPPEKHLTFAAWMLRGIAVHELIAWFKGMQQSAPPPVFEKFCQLAEKTLTQARWDRVREAVQLTQPAA